MSVAARDGASGLLTRYRDDPTAPPLLSAVRDLAVRALLPGLALIAVGLGVGALVTGPMAGWIQEGQVNAALQQTRTPLLDEVARTASAIGGVTGNEIICVVSVALIFLLTRRWWLAVLPVVALDLHIFVHITTSTIIARPRPPVEHLDIGQPTASFPSGHMGATTAQLLVVLLFACSYVRSRVLRAVLAVVVAGYLVVLGWSRLYLGMHYPSDVAWGAVNGVACGLVGWLFLRRDPASGPGPRRVEDRSADPHRSAEALSAVPSVPTTHTFARRARLKE